MQFWKNWRSEASEAFPKLRRTAPQGAEVCYNQFSSRRLFIITCSLNCSKECIATIILNIYSWIRRSTVCAQSFMSRKFMAADDTIAAKSFAFGNNIHGFKMLLKKLDMSNQSFCSIWNQPEYIQKTSFASYMKPVTALRLSTRFKPRLCERLQFVRLRKIKLIYISYHQIPDTELLLPLHTTGRRIHEAEVVIPLPTGC